MSKDKCQTQTEQVTGRSNFPGEVQQAFLEGGVVKLRPEKKVGIRKKSISRGNWICEDIFYSDSTTLTFIQLFICLWFPLNREILKGKEQMVPTFAFLPIKLQKWWNNSFFQINREYLRYLCFLFLLFFDKGFCLFNTSEKNADTKNWDVRKHWFNTHESTRMRIWERWRRLPKHF